MKVGIMSMQRIANYGSFLQAYALKQLIQELGYEVEFVDYHVGMPLIKCDNTNAIVRKLKKGIETIKYNASFLHKVQYILFKESFNKKYMPILGVYENMNYRPKLDTLVIGSDEVFNCVQSNSNVGYSLELFGKNNNADKLITYAASFGNTSLYKLEKYNKTQEIANLLDDFDDISVRDENSAEIVRKLTGKEVVYNLDPGLIYDYMNQCDKIKKVNVKDKYIILYAYSGRITKQEAKWIKKYAKEHNLKIYAIGGIQECADKFIDCSPFEVLSYFNQAEKIITDTFHGSIFSIITHKQFATLIRKSVDDGYGNEEKLMDLLTRVGLEKRGVYDVHKVSKVLDNDIDYEMVESFLVNERAKAKLYLEKELKK